MGGVRGIYSRDPRWKVKRRPEVNVQSILALEAYQKTLLNSSKNPSDMIFGIKIWRSSKQFGEIKNSVIQIEVEVKSNFV